VAQLVSTGSFPTQATGVLQHFGFAGDSTGPQSRADALGEAFRHLLAAPSAIGGYPTNSTQYGISNITPDATQALRWNIQLARDFKRATFEIYL
jgi:hypothetical protein